MRLLLIRHPEPQIPKNTCYGRQDLPLSPTGTAQLSPLAAQLRTSKITKIYTSPAQRCRALARLLTPDPVIDPRLQELDFGAWEGLPWDRIPHHELNAWAAAPLAFAPPCGEPVADLRARLESLVADLRARAEDAILITHGGPLRLLPALLQNIEPDPLAPSPAFASITPIDLPAPAVQTSPQRDQPGEHQECAPTSPHRSPP